MSRDIVIRPAEPEEMDAVRQLFVEYAAWLEVDLCFQGFEAELAGLPGRYAPPRGGIWLGLVDGDLAGVVALRGLSDHRCEMKRLWVRAPFRGLSLGRQLARRCINEGLAAAYSEMVLDTLSTMTAALSLYGSLGFARCDAYYDNPHPDVCYLRLDLCPEEVAAPI